MNSQQNFTSKVGIKTSIKLIKFFPASVRCFVAGSFYSRKSYKPVRQQRTKSSSRLVPGGQDAVGTAKHTARFGKMLPCSHSVLFSKKKILKKIKLLKVS